MKVLVVGGAGYIGSHMVKRLLRCGHEAVTFDDLSSGHRDAVLGGGFERASLADRSALDTVFRKYRFDAVMHFASFIQVGESVAKPAKYYRNNYVGTLNLLDAMIAAGVFRLVFSSTAAIFGYPRQKLIDESHPKAPLNPYGRSKLMVEETLADYDRAYGLKSICLRYFNAAGADPEGKLGERHDPETHLIPLVLRVVLGKRPDIGVFGGDYPTADGTCIRDYIHVEDLCEAHLLALDRLQREGKSDAFNLGNGTGFSVLEVIETARRITGHPIPLAMLPRREGDAAQLVADSRRAREILGWNPAHGRLEEIIENAWRWEQRATNHVI